MAKSFVATDEQLATVDMFSSGRHLQINAFAGTGKTSTLDLISRSTRKSGRYIAFNRSMASDAQSRFPQNVVCTTGHGAAYRDVLGIFGGVESKLTGAISTLAIVDWLNPQPLKSGSFNIPPRSLAFLIQKTLNRFLHSADRELSNKHFANVGALGYSEFRHHDEITALVVQHARRLWGKMCDPKSPVPLGHDGYLKYWALSNPSINTDFVMLDEAQDSNPVILDVIQRQPCQVVYVGDKYQQIYEWRGAINAMDSLSNTSVCFLTLSFRFGQQIADAANRVLAKLGEDNQIRGNPKVRSRLAEAETEVILARSNGRIIAEVVGALQRGKKPSIIGGASELLRMLEGVSDLRAARATPVEEFLGFGHWRDVEEFSRSAEGRHLLPFVASVDKWGEKVLVSALNQVVDEPECDLVISTVHKAKGREWSKVRVVGHFGANMDELMRGNARRSRKRQNPENLRLLYVAMTRAKAVLHVAIDDELSKEETTSSDATPTTRYSDRYFTDHDRVASGQLRSFRLEQKSGYEADELSGGLDRVGDERLKGFWKSFVKK